MLRRVARKVEPPQTSPLLLVPHRQVRKKAKYGIPALLQRQLRLRYNIFMARQIHRVSREAISAAADDIAASGKTPTLVGVRQIVGGEFHYTGSSVSEVARGAGGSRNGTAQRGGPRAGPETVAGFGEAAVAQSRGAIQAEGSGETRWPSVRAAGDAGSAGGDRSHGRPASSQGRGAGGVLHRPPRRKLGACVNSWRRRCGQPSSPVHRKTSCGSRSMPLVRASARISLSVSPRLRAADLTDPG